MALSIFYYGSQFQRSHCDNHFALPLIGLDIFAVDCSLTVDSAQVGVLEQTEAHHEARNEWAALYLTN